MANLAVPQTADSIDVLVSLVIPEKCHLSAHNIDERIGRWFSK
jgi:hypothetical protein